jgi:hypothetical protein
MHITHVRYKTFVQHFGQKTEGNRPPRRHKRKFNLKEIRRKCVDWIHLAQDMERRPALVNAEISSGSVKERKFLD